MNRSWVPVVLMVAAWIASGSAFGDAETVDFDALMLTVANFEYEGDTPFQHFLHPDSADNTGPGIPDATELAVLAAVFADVEAPNHNLLHEGWKTNVAQCAIDLGALAESLVPELKSVMAGYALIGDGSYDPETGHQIGGWGIYAEVLEAMADYGSAWGSGAPDEANYSRQPELLSACGDADGDEVRNVNEFYAAGGRAAYVAAVLDPSTRASAEDPLGQCLEELEPEVVDFDALMLSLAEFTFAGQHPFERYDPSVADLNENGVLDAVEFAVLSAIFADADMPNYSVLHVAWRANVEQSHNDLGALVNSLVPATAPVIAAYALLGEGDLDREMDTLVASWGSWGVVAVAIWEGADGGSQWNSGAPRDSDYGRFAGLVSLCGDADGDGVSNIREFHGQSGDRAAYVAAVLDSGVVDDGGDPGVVCNGGAAGALYTGDRNADLDIELSELLRMIQFFNSNGYHCDGIGEDGYATGPGATGCQPHGGDYNPQDWALNLSELLRVIQFFNTGGYHACAGTEDGFCAGPPT